MKISSFNDDLLNIEDFAKKLERFIAVEEQYVEGGLLVGLSSRFGTGKSIFLQIWQTSLSDNEERQDPLLITLLNA